MVDMLKLILIFLVLVFILFIIFRKTFKVGSSFKMLSLAIIVSIIVFVVIGVILYINNVDYEMLGKNKDYIIGQITYRDDEKIKIRIIEHNLDKDLEVNSVVVIKLQKETVLKKQTAMLLEKKIEVSDLKVGNRVNVICEVRNDNIVAQKIILK